MDSDRELLELAAKACGIKLFIYGNIGHEGFQDMEAGKPWNPLSSDGDALRLAIKLHIDLVFMPEHDSVVAHHDDCQCVDALDDFGTRRVIVRAAAEIGKSMPELTK